jgi:peptidoglycan/LPS O-acetylase OafA/YrhL
VRDFRPEIQVLRAVAVMLVVVFHLWPKALSGGYVGVDVFFVISGYLITAHLLRELESTGRLDLRAFWARRIRRLLPAAALVLAATLVGTLLFAPGRAIEEATRQIGASAIGLQNWLLATSAVDYFGQNNVPTAVQHYWSLSLEEQFYVVWPVLLLVVALVVRRRWAIPAIMGAVVVGSLAWSVYATATSPASAYFSTFTHGWEFALGGLLARFAPALSASGWMRRPRLRSVVMWLGLAAIGASAALYAGSTPFPGWTALLPVGGTLAVIAAGSTGSRIQAARVLFSRPVQFVGGVSYSTYLWHWPLIVIIPQALGYEVGIVTRLMILVASVALGWLTKKFIEDPARTSRLLNGRRVVTYGAAVLVAGSLVVASAVAWNVGAARAADERAAASALIDQALDDGNPCFGAAAATAPCPDSHRVDPRFGPDFAADDWGAVAGVNKDGTLPDLSLCVDFSGTGAGYLDCKAGPQESGTVLAIVGDSHALALTEPLLHIADAEGWSVRVFLHNSCTASLPMDYSTSAKASCNDWRHALSERIAADPDIDLVVTTGFTRGEPEPTYAGTRADLVQGYAGLWTGWADRGKRVFVIEDVPLTTGESVPECVGAHEAEDDPCSVPRGQALAWDPVVDAVSAAADPDVSLIDVTDAFCDTTTCHSVIGGLIAYRDPHHLSATFALTLVPQIREALDAR